MALVLKKAVLSKNTSLLKCMKGRHFLSTANKKSPAVTTAACARRRFREKSLLCGWAWKIETGQRAQCTRSRYKTGRNLRARCCFSCPELVNRERPPPRHNSPVRLSSLPDLARDQQAFRATARNISTLSPTRSAPGPKPTPAPAQQFSTISQARSAAACQANPTAVQPKTPTAQSQRPYTCKCGCGCPFPCGPFGNCKGCCCLPPPCNTPPRCIQYMTGYYYYPYGFWFCGPYHVTGLCCPVSGSCGCGCGGCCGKCCGCCLCPDLAGITGAAMATGIPAFAPPETKRVFQTQLGKGFPIKEKEVKDPSAHLSMNKFIPFSTTVAPSVQAKSSKTIVQGAFNDKRKSFNFKGPDRKSGSTRSYSSRVR